MCALLLGAGAVSADEVELKTASFGLFKDVNGNGVLDDEERSCENKLGCAVNILEYLSADTSYDYKQYNTPPGSGPDHDISAWPNNSDGLFVSGLNTTWLEPQLDELQFYMGYSRRDHDSQTPEYDDAPKGFHLSMIMNRPEILLTDGTIKGKEGEGFNQANPFSFPIYKPTDGVVKNSVQLDLAVAGSSLDPFVALSDDVETTAANPTAAEPPRPLPAGTVLSGQEFVATTLTQDLIDDGYSDSFTGEWTYNEDTTDGGVLGNLLPDENDDFVIRVDLTELGDGDDAIQTIVFYTFAHDDINDPNDLNPYLQTFQMIELELAEGETFFITDDCNCIVPEPGTMILLALGTSAWAATFIRRRRRA
jgi:hypothetical protein